MTAMKKSIHHIRYQFDRCEERFAFRHPYAAFLALFLAMPILILLAVVSCATIIALPIAWICGWL